MRERERGGKEREESEDDIYVKSERMDVCLCACAAVSNKKLISTWSLHPRVKLFTG